MIYKLKNATYLVAILYFSLIFFNSRLFAQPELFRRIALLSEYAASEEYEEIVKIKNHLAAVDSLYARALILCENDKSKTLLTLAFATLPYDEIPIVIPFIKFKLSFPLPRAEKSLFLKKNENLPAKLFFDSPNNFFGDKDKLAHFFGSAYLSYALFPFEFTKNIGIFVEDFEKTFKAQSEIDNRDLRTNALGAAFGVELKKNGDILPSSFFVLYTILTLNAFL